MKIEKLSPMMQHYCSVKEKYPNCIIFYRLGDFYEVFFEDAIEVSQILDITLTGKECGLTERAPMCGVPYHSADSYIAKLVAAGKKVAICEQVGQVPPNGKGLVERTVIRVVSAGTVIDGNYLQEKENNYIASICKREKECAIAWIDITTGEFFTITFKGKMALQEALDFMLKCNVAEIIANDVALLQSKNLKIVESLPPLSCYLPWVFQYKQAEQILQKHFACTSLAKFGLKEENIAICACGALISYLEETQMHALKNIDSLQVIKSSDSMQLDSNAVQHLELLMTVDRQKKHSLFSLLDRTKTAMGARLLQKWLLSPLQEIAKINDRLFVVEELYNASIMRKNVQETLAKIKDIERITGKISNQNLSPRDCEQLANSLLQVPILKKDLAGTKSKLSTYFLEIDKILHLANQLKEAFVENAPVNSKDGNFIRVGYNKHLDELKNLKENGTQLLANLESREREKTGIRSLKIKYNRVFGYSFEVPNSFKDKVPYEYKRRQTLTTAERYVTEELQEIEAALLSSSEKSLQLEQELFQAFKEILTEEIYNLKAIATAIAEIDCFVSLASVAKEYNYVKPNFTENRQQFKIIEGRHPVVEVISKNNFMPNDCIFDANCKSMLITGPNMAGKSTYMRQTALIVILAHMGSFVPAKSCELPIIDKIFTRIGASDNLTADQSTFMVEMNEVATIMQYATKDSLLILDEVGRGTSTYDGLSIAWAVLETITKDIGAKTMFATHYHELTKLESEMEGVQNYRVTVKETEEGIIFLRKILRGGANKSFGIEVARLAGIPNPVTSRAKEILSLLEENQMQLHTEKNPMLRQDRDKKKDAYAEILASLKAVDIDSITPIQSLQILANLVTKIQK